MAGIEKEAEEIRGEYLQFDYTEDEAIAFDIGYIAGAKAHLPQWHDLRKDPEDLPKTDADVVCYCGKEWRKVIGKYWREYKKWEVEGVVAWYEIPELEE